MLKLALHRSLSGLWELKNEPDCSTLELSFLVFFFHTSIPEAAISKFLFAMILAFQIILKRILDSRLPRLELVKLKLDYAISTLL